MPRDLPRGEVPDAVMPPLGCSFHPRCPRAFEVCGWESRDLRAMLEARWLRLSKDDYEAERAAIADLDALDRRATVARLEPAGGHEVGEVLEILERLRADAPEDPFWKGVATVEAEDGCAVVRFHEALAPVPLDVEGQRVECHLHDPDALAQAERLRGAGAVSGGAG